MIVYNVTVKVDLDISREWLIWMQEKHIPDVMATGFFVDHKVHRIMELNETDGFTYAIQYRTDSMAKLRTYQDEAAPALIKEHTERYGSKCVSFRTIMREL